MLAHAQERLAPLVLLVQEDDEARETLRRALEHDGMFVVEARVAQEALATLRLGPPDVIAIDVASGIGGFGVCQRLRQQAHGERVPIIALAEVPSASDNTKRPTETSCDVVLGKPCAAEALATEIWRLVVPDEPARHSRTTPRKRGVRSPAAT